MKSKRLLSLAMAAVMSVSALGYCAAVKAPVGVVANASVKYSSDEVSIPLEHLQAKVVYTQSEFDALWEKNNALRYFPKIKDDRTLVGNDGKELSEETTGEWLAKYQLSAYRYKETDESLTKLELEDATKKAVPFWVPNLKKPKNTATATYFGWKKIDVKNYYSNTAYEANKTAVVDLVKNVKDEEEADKVRLHSNDPVELEKDGDNYAAAFQTVVRKVELTDEAIMAEIERREKEAAEKAETDKKNNSKASYVSRKQGQWNGFDNVINTGKGTKESKFLYRNSKETAGVVYIPPEGKGHYSAADVKYLFKICGVTDVEQAFLFDVSVPNGYELIDGKNMIVRLDLPEGITTGYSIYVYHMVNGYAKRIRKVGWRTDYVVFAANSFSPYVLVMTPNNQKRGVASTGAVLYANPPTGDGDVVPVAMLAATAIATSCLLTVRKRREQEV